MAIKKASTTGTFTAFFLQVREECAEGDIECVGQCALRGRARATSFLQVDDGAARYTGELGELQLGVAPHVAPVPDLVHFPITSHITSLALSSRASTIF